MDQEQVMYLQALRSSLQKQLARLERKAAKQGIKADPAILIQIEDLKREIAALEKRFATANDQVSQPDDIHTVLAELGRKLAAGDLTDLAVLAVTMQSGKEIVWSRSSANLLRLLAALAENFMQDPAEDEASAALGSLTDDEAGELAAVLLQLHREITIHPRGKQ